MGAPSQTKGAPKPRPRACRPASPAPTVRLPFGTTTTTAPIAARVKTAIVVRAVWPGFRSA